MKRRFRVKLIINFDYRSNKEDLKEFISHLKCIRGSRFMMERSLSGFSYYLFNLKFTLSGFYFGIKEILFYYEKKI